MISCFDKTGKNQVKARCALIILNRVNQAFPNNYDQAKSIQRALQEMIDAGDSIAHDLRTLTGRLNEKMKEKVNGFPEHAKALKKEAAEKAA